MTLVLFTQQGPRGCPADASCVGCASMLVARVAPHHFFGKAKPRGGTATSPELWRDRWWFPSPTPARSSCTGRFLTRVHSNPPCHHHRRKPGRRGKQSTLGLHPTEVLRSATYLLSSQRPREGSRRVSISPTLSTLHALLKPVRRQGLQPKSRRFWVGGLLKNEKLGHAYKTSRESGAMFQ